MSAIMSTKVDFLQRVADALTAVEKDLESMFDCRLSPAELAALHPQVEERLAQVVDLSVDSLMYLSPLRRWNSHTRPTPAPSNPSFWRESAHSTTAPIVCLNEPPLCTVAVPLLGVGGCVREFEGTSVPSFFA